MASVVEGSRDVASGRGDEAAEGDGAVGVGSRERSWEMAVGTDMNRGGSKILRPLRTAQVSQDQAEAEGEPTWRDSPRSAP